MHSINFEKFKISFFDNSNGAAQNGIDTEALLALKGIERKEAETLLLDAIKTSEDDRPFAGVGYLSLQESTQIIKRVFLK